MADDYLRRNSVRLLREKWASPSALAEELYMINSDEPSRQGNAVSPVAQARAQQEAIQAPKIPESKSLSSREMFPPKVPPKPLADVLASVAEQVSQYPRQSPVDAILPNSTTTRTAMPFSAILATQTPPQFSPAQTTPIESRRAAETYQTPTVSGGIITGWSVEPDTNPVPGQTVYQPRREMPAWQPPTPFDSISLTSYALTGSAPQVGTPGIPLAPVASIPSIGSSSVDTDAIDYAGTLDRLVVERNKALDALLYNWPSPMLPYLSNASLPAGQVTDGSQSPVLQVLLYPDGPTNDPSPSTPVSVAILQLATNDIVPNGTWITGISQLGANYYAQLPIWLANDNSGSATTSGTGTA